MLTEKRLSYLASRLAKFNAPECAAAAAAIEAFLITPSNWTGEYDLYHSVWEEVSRALDHCEYSPEYELELDAIEAELCGRVLFMRQQGHGAKETTVSTSRPRSILQKMVISLSTRRNG